jgi:hypothetical protein
MNHSEAIYDAIPEEIRELFIRQFLVMVSETVEMAEIMLSNEDRVRFLTALGKAGADGDFQAMYEAFGRLVIDL